MGILTTPDGTRIQVPDNATPEQVKQIFSAYGAEKRQQSAQAGRDTAWEDTPWHEKAMIGFAKPFVETGLGVKALLTDLSQDDKNLLEAGKGVKGVAGTAGEIAGNVATFAVPGGLAAQGGKAAARVLPRAIARTTPEIGAVAAVEALRAPTEDRSRAQAALHGAMGAGIGAGAGKLLGKVVSGVAKSQPAKQLMDKGVPLTPGMASAGKFVPWLEQRMSALPLVGGKVAKLQGRALEQWNRSTLQSVAPPGATIARAGSKGFDDLQRAFSDSYGAIWDQRIPLRSNPSDAWRALVPAIKARLTKKQAHKVARNLDQVDEVFTVANKLASVGQNNGNVLSQIDDMLRQFIRQAQKKGDDDVVAFYQQARDGFRQALPEQVNATLAELDRQYAKYAIVQKAATYKKPLESGLFTPADLMGAVKAKGSQRALSRGEALLQDHAAKAVDIFEGLVPNRNKLERTIVGGLAAGGTFVEPVTGMALVGGLALPNEIVRKLMTGHYRARPAALAKVLRDYGVTPSTVVAAGVESGDPSR